MLPYIQIVEYFLIIFNISFNSNFTRFFSVIENILMVCTGEYNLQHQPVQMESWKAFDSHNDAGKDTGNLTLES